MAKVFLVPIDLNGNELQNGVFQNLATAPSSPAEGRFYYDTDDNTVYFWNGTTWVDMGQTGGGGGFTQEEIEDFVGAMLTGNTETGISVTYEDGDSTIDFVISSLDLLPLAAGDLNLNTNKIINLVDGTADTDAATVGQVDDAIAAAIAALVDSAPSTLDTLNELAAALGDDPNFASTLTTTLAGKADTYAVNVGDNSSTAIVITHNLGTRDVTVSLKRNSTPWDEVECDVEATSTNTVTLRFTTAPTTDQFRVTVIG
jgi:hypothetical protein